MKKIADEKPSWLLLIADHLLREVQKENQGSQVNVGVGVGVVVFFVSTYSLNNILGLLILNKN